MLLLLPGAGKFGKWSLTNLKGEVGLGSAVLGATLGEAPVGRDERLGVGIAEGRLREWEASARRE